MLPTSADQYPGGVRSQPSDTVWKGAAVGGENRTLTFFALGVQTRKLVACRGRE